MTPWQVGYGPHASSWLKKADPQTARRIRDALTAIAGTGNPRSRGKALQGGLAGLWRYRVGDYRIICDIQDGRLLVLALEIGNRDRIYNKGSW